MTLSNKTPRPATSATSRVAPSRGVTTVSTDGSCLKNPGGAIGWAWVDHTGARFDSGGAASGTNQIAELTAVLEAVRSNPGPGALLIEADSQYAIRCASEWLPGWKRKGWRTASGGPVKNLELVQAIDAAITEREGPVRFRWVRGHIGHQFNERADQLAGIAARDWAAGRGTISGALFADGGAAMTTTVDSQAEANAATAKIPGCVAEGATHRNDGRAAIAGQARNDINVDGDAGEIPGCVAERATHRNDGKAKIAGQARNDEILMPEIEMAPARTVGYVPRPESLIVQTFASVADRRPARSTGNAGLEDTHLKAAPIRTDSKPARDHGAAKKPILEPAAVTRTSELAAATGSAPAAPRRRRNPAAQGALF